MDDAVLKKVISAENVRTVAVKIEWNELRAEDREAVPVDSRSMWRHVKQSSMGN